MSDERAHVEATGPPIAPAADVITINGGMVNAYLLKSGGTFVLVDTLTRGKRDVLLRGLQDAGCSAESLALIVVTHGDPDHTGSCAHLRRTFGTKIAMHTLERPAAERGDMAATRGQLSGVARFLFSVLGSIFRPRREDLFSPDIELEDGQSLSGYGLDAIVLFGPGHSKGSISVLTARGDLICGDLMTNRGTPAANSLVDDKAQMLESIERARRLGAKTVFPGHGRPFAMSEIAPGEE